MEAGASIRHYRGHSIMTTKLKTKSLEIFRESGIILVLIAIVVLVSIINPVFISLDNVINIFRSSSFVFIVGIAMTFVLIAGGLDLSVAPVLALGGIISSLIIFSGMPTPVGIAGALCIGAAIGLINGILISVFAIPPLIVTLGMMYIGRGLVLIITKGAPIYPLPDRFTVIGQGALLGIPYVILLALALGIVAHFVLKKTIFGRSVYAIGGNEETARLAGIRIKRIKIIVYMLSGMAAALAGTVMAARLSSAQASSGTGYELLVIASVIIGGTSMFGGSGKILGTAAGALLMTVIKNAMVILKISVYWQNLVIGVVIILAVGIDQYQRRKSGLR